MCGIAGGAWIEQPKKLNEMLDKAILSMRFRGPNDQGVEFINAEKSLVALAHTRLSIIDLSDAGHQPMHSNDKRYSIVFNGEIYNYRELRKELTSLGYLFRTDSDTEVLLAAWQCWGQDCLVRLVGMFAFVIFDREANTLTCARDPFGIKPFFYTIENGNFLFASEIPAIKALKNSKIELDWQRSYDYLVHGDYDSSARSFIAGVSHLLPGCVLTVNLNNGQVGEPIVWWHLNITENKNISFTDAADELRERFLNNIRLHLRSDVPLGSALSGGVDSSAVVCAMRHIEPDVTINTFSYVAHNSSFSEEQWVDKINQHTNAIAHKIIVHPSELANDLDEMILAQGEPFGSTSIYAQYRVYKLAKENGITVTLDGQGADELLAGYNGYPSMRIKSMLDKNQYIDAYAFLSEWSKWPGRNVKDCLKGLVAEYVDGSLFQLLHKLNGRNHTPLWLNDDLLRESGVFLGHPRQLASYNTKGRRLAAHLAFSLNRRGLPSLLRHGDRSSMRWSVESRVPFLTSDIANFLLSLPENYLISQQGETKSVFRAAMRGIVPDEVLDRRDKIGFETPEKIWLVGMETKIRDCLSIDIGLPFLNQKEVINEFNSILAGKKPFSWQVWRWVNFIRWHQLFF
jgi:asparagine synthase (glutamine-hydrolysing)